MTILVTSLLPTSQTIDSVALAAYASQYRSGTTDTMTAALIAAVAAKQIQVVDTDVPTGEVKTAAATLTKAHAGRTIFLDSATEFAVTLPAPELGLEFEFVVKTAPSGASYTVVSSGGANIIKGAVFTTDVNSATDPDLETSGGDTITFVDAKAVAGDSVVLRCDGTNWFAKGFCTVFDAITITTAA